LKAKHLLLLLYCSILILNVKITRFESVVTLTISVSNNAGVSRQPQSLEADGAPQAIRDFFNFFSKISHYQAYFFSYFC